MSVKRALFFGYIGLLLASAVWKKAVPLEIPPRLFQKTVEIEGEEGNRVVIRYLDTKKEGTDSRPVVVLLHGSPMASEIFDEIIPFLEKDYRLIAPDLPGFGRSQRDIPDYSIRAHAAYLKALLRELKIGRCHLAGYSMGGGVALEFVKLDPQSVDSLILTASIGLQEYELLGDYTLNHALHAAQLFCLWAVDWFTPHFGWMDRALLNYEYARNFYDTDQRLLREAIEEWPKPVWIGHGAKDRLVPVGAARAHKELMPQARLEIYEDAGHLMIYRRPERIAKDWKRFLQEVEAGDSPIRAQFDGIALNKISQPTSKLMVPHLFL